MLFSNIYQPLTKITTSLCWGIQIHTTFPYQKHTRNFHNSTMAASSMFKLSFFLSLLSHLNLGLWPQTHSSLAIFPPSCKSIECPSFDTIEVGNGYEVRRYNSSEWISTSPIQDISLVEATRTGFLQ